MGMGAVVVRFGLYLALMHLFGLASFGVYALRGDERRFGATLRFAPLIVGTASLAALLSILGLLFLASSMAAVPLTSVDRLTVEIILWGTAVGAAWQVRMIALFAAILIALAGIRYPRQALIGVTLAAAIATATLAWTGHGAADQGMLGWIHLVADIAHLLAAGIWIGALFGLTMLVFRSATRIDRQHLVLSHRVLHGFSTIGGLVVAIILISGLINAWILVGLPQVATLPQSLYGRLLIAKLLLFAVMIVLASANRFHLTPVFKRAIADENHVGAVRALRRSLTIETSCGVAILSLVAWLGTLQPPASAMT